MRCLREAWPDPVLRLLAPSDCVPLACRSQQIGAACVQLVYSMSVQPCVFQRVRISNCVGTAMENSPAKYGIQLQVSLKLLT